jgi:hypothetical protein
VRERDFKKLLIDLHCTLEFRKCFLKSPWGERKRERENVYICEGKKERER